MAVKPVKVSQLNGYISRVLQTDPLLGNLSVIGEISNLKYHGSGHVFFSLKDEKSTVNCFLAAGNLRHIRYELAEGMEIIAHGYISVYQAGGRYSLNIRDIDVAGQGDLAAAFEKLKEKLAAEGLFDEAQKKLLPEYPKKIAVVTSETGAAVRDIIKIIKRRNDVTSVLVYPVLVQGPDAAPDIAAAIEDINRMDDIDIIITGRGGGSMEDLWAFNEEIVARSIYRSVIPVISAVGHETDFTIADFVADKRAETPTAAAQMAVPDTQMLKKYLKDLKDGLAKGLNDAARYKEARLKQFDFASLKKSMLLRIDAHKARTDLLKKNMFSELVPLMTAMQARVDAAGKEIRDRMDAGLKERQMMLERMGERLRDNDPAAIIKKGYAAVVDKERNLVRGTEALDIDDDVTLVFSDGDADCRVTDIRRKTDGQ